MRTPATKKPKKEDDFLSDLKKAVRSVIQDDKATKRDINAAVANGAKLLAIEHKISPGSEEDFFGG